MKNKIFYIFAFFLSLSFFFSIDNVKALNSGSAMTNCVGAEWDSSIQDWKIYYNTYSTYLSDLWSFIANTTDSRWVKYQEFLEKKKNGEEIYIMFADFSKSSNSYYGLTFIISDKPFNLLYHSSSNYKKSDYLWVNGIYTGTSGTNYIYYQLLDKNGNEKENYSYASITNSSIFYDSTGISILYTNYDLYENSEVNDVVPSGNMLASKSFFSQNICEACSVTLSNPTFSNKYITGEIPGYEEEQNVASLLDIDFGVYDTSKYYYYISTDSAESWENVTSYMTDSHFTHTMVKNGTVIAKMVSKSNGDEVYSTFTTDSINENALSYFIKYITNENENVYVEVDGKKYLQKKYLGIEPRYNKLEDNFPFNYKISFGNDIWENMLNNAMSFYYFDKNTTVYISVYDKYGRELGIYSTFTITGLEDIEIIGEKIIFTEECDKEKCIVSVSFTNYTSEHFYWVKTGNQAYKKIDPSEYQGVYYFEDTSDVTTYCARITDKNVGNLGIVQDKCFITNGNSDSSKVTVNIFANIFDDFRTNIMSIVDVFTNFYNGLPDDIQNMFYLCLFILLTISLFKFLI